MHRQTGLAPIFDCDARLLILGSFPGKASLAAQAYYAHPRNQFWPILSDSLRRPLCDASPAVRAGILIEQRIALWDVIERCHPEGSLDSAIRDAKTNPLRALIDRLPLLERVLFNGRAAATAGRRIVEAAGIAYLILPSTSPANASISYSDKLALWRAALEPSA